MQADPAISLTGVRLRTFYLPEPFDSSINTTALLGLKKELFPIHTNLSGKRQDSTVASHRMTELGNPFLGEYLGLLKILI